MISGMMLVMENHRVQATDSRPPGPRGTHVGGRYLMIHPARVLVVALLIAVTPLAAPLQAQERETFEYQQPLMLTDAGSWPLERLGPVTLVLDRIERFPGGLTFWLWIDNRGDWPPDAPPSGPCCVFSLSPERIALVDAAGQRYEGEFDSGGRHVVGPGQRLTLLANHRGLSPRGTALELHVDGGAAVVSERPADRPVAPPPASEPLDEETLAYLRSLDPVEHAQWVLTGVRLPE
jgi:hypothetical protein